MLRPLALLFVLLLLAGCTSYPSFTGSVTNQSADPAEVQVTILREQELIFRADHIVGAGTTWNLGAFTRQEGTYTIQIEVGGLLAVREMHFFGHDEGPGGFRGRINATGAVDLSYWHN